MPKKEEKAQLKTLESVEVAGYELLNDDKVARALDEVGEGASEEALLAAYDKLGGGIKKDGRKLEIGSFYDFILKKPRENVKFDELEFEDELVVVRKPAANKKAKGEDVKDRVKRVLGSKKANKKAKGEVTEE